MDEPRKPELHLADPRGLTFEKLLEMFRRLTGREPTPEEVERVRAKWADFEAQQTPTA